MRILFIALFFTFSGCASQPVQIAVPIQVPCPAPVVPERPVLPLSAITTASPPDDVVKAYAASILILEGYAAQLETLLGTNR